MLKDVVEHLIGIDSDLLDSRDDKGDTALHYACRERNYKVAKYLLNRHMQLVTKRNTQGDLPVYLLGGSGEDGSNTTSFSSGGRQSFFTFNSGSTSRVKYGSDANKKTMKLSTQLFPIKC